MSAITCARTISLIFFTRLLRCIISVARAAGEDLVADSNGFRISAERLARYRRPRHEGAVFVERRFKSRKAQIAQKHAAYFFRFSSFHTV